MSLKMDSLTETVWSGPPQTFGHLWKHGDGQDWESRGCGCWWVKAKFIVNTALLGQTPSPHKDHPVPSASRFRTGNQAWRGDRLLLVLPSFSTTRLVAVSVCSHPKGLLLPRCMRVWVLALPGSQTSAAGRWACLGADGKVCKPCHLTGIFCCFL